MRTMAALMQNTGWNLTLVMVVLLFTFVSASPNQAQTSVQILCDTTFERYETIRPLPGTVYRALLNEDRQPTYEIEQLNQGGTQVWEIPLPPELVGNVYPEIVSPDGRYLVLKPLIPAIPLVVWKIGMAELATVYLPDTDVEYLTTYIESLSRWEKVLTWENESHILIRYFDLEYSYYDHILAERVLTVIDTPFQVVDEGRVDISYPILSPPEPSTLPRPSFSPQRSFVTLVTTYLDNRFQVYDMRSGQPVLAADLQSDETSGIVGEPYWLPDESQFFMTTWDRSVSARDRLTIRQVNVEQGFQVNTGLWTALESAFDADVMLEVGFEPAINTDGTRVAFRVSVQGDLPEYVIVYQPETGSITAICDESHSNLTNFYPLWGPDDNTFGYWANGWMIAYDLTTGQGYQIDGTGFLSWTEEVSVPPTASAGSD